MPMTETAKKVKPTISTIFMVPTLRINREEILNNGFLNGYSKDNLHEEEYEDAVYVLYRPPDLDRFREFLEKEYERTSAIITDYDHPGRFVVAVYKLDEKFKEDFEIVKSGKYSKTSESFKKLFPQVTKIVINGRHMDELSLQTRIFKKTTDLKEFWEEKFGVEFDEEQEVWSGYIEENETLTQEKLDEY